MKGKIKLDGAALKQFFLRNGEKIAVGAVLLVFLWMAYAALQVEAYSKTPADLQRLATNARGTVTRDVTQAEISRLVEQRDGVSSDQVADPTTIGGQAVAVESYQWPTPLNPPLIERKIRRGQPTLFPIEKLRAAGGHGAFEFRNQPQPQPRQPAVVGENRLETVAAAPLSPYRGQRWAVITGLTPLRKQAAEYTRRFEHALADFDPQRDAPEYLYFEVQRAEVLPGQQTVDEAAWRKLDVNEMRKRDAAWSRTQQEVCETRFVMQKPTDPGISLTRPLPPLVGDAWGESVVHPPEIPLALDRSLLNERGVVDEEVMEPEDSSESPFFGPMDERGDPRGEGPRGSFSTSPRSGDPLGEPPYKLFRCFDTDVAEGGRYVYRVRVLLRNPNHGIPTHLLDDGELAKSPYIWTDWSEPTPVVEIPRDSHLLAGQVLPRRGSQEQRAQVLVEHFDAVQGVKAYKEFDGVVRGQMVNYANQEVLAHDPADRGGGRGVDVTADIFTETTLVDMSGDEMVVGRKRETTPGRILLLEPSGALVVRTETGDRQAYDTALAAIELLQPTTPTVLGAPDDPFGQGLEDD